ncbi:MAG TPA: HAD family hydrolase [Candidatus Dormibacteraeota bacterium]|nr:HAD family hydrolase [Candidatus Dormibacteraeota bacterium]
MDPKLEAVVFDWGGTLTPFHAIDLADLWAVAARILAPDHAEDLTAALLAAERESWDRVASQAGMASATLHDLLHVAAERTGVAIEEAVRDEALEAHLEAWTPHTLTDPEAAPLLRALRERGIRTGLLSNTHWPREWHERILARDGVLDLLEVRIYTSELRHTKPHAEAFRAVLGPLDVPAEHAVMVGDRPFDDISGAQALGMRTVLLPNGFVPPAPVTPDATITRLSELLPIVDAWRNGG